jgi:hypothetical protein
MFILFSKSLLIRWDQRSCDLAQDIPGIIEDSIVYKSQPAQTWLTRYASPKCLVPSDEEVFNQKTGITGVAWSLSPHPTLSQRERAMKKTPLDSCGSHRPVSVFNAVNG